jgi:hypothetical protein
MIRKPASPPEMIGIALEVLWRSLMLFGFSILIYRFLLGLYRFFFINWPGGLQLRAEGIWSRNA